MEFDSELGKFSILKVDPTCEKLARPSSSSPYGIAFFQA